ncbi:MAG: sensor domain-containing diguanylate cyclase [Oscillospiraceae bacterium]|nr:sensor domain-containing diguanylate cyclase [Oscillospiraceae bacterium]
MITKKGILDEYSRYKYVVENIKDVIWELDTNMIFTFISPTVKGMTGYNDCEIIGRCMLDFLTDKSKKLIMDQVKKRRDIGSKGDSPLYDVKFVCKDGHKIWCEVCVKPIFKDETLICYIGTSRDISEKKMYEQKLKEMITQQKRTNKQLENLATFDMLTGTYNRRKFEYFVNCEVEKVERYGTTFSISMFDIDNFKQINDVNGHDKGDIVLHDIASLIKRTIRATDLLFRWGGDEFIVLFPDLSLENALVVANKIRETVYSYKFGIEVEAVTISLGIGTYNLGENMDQFVSRVDKALLRAKKNGKNTIEQC